MTLSKDNWRLQANTWIEIGYSCVNTPLLPKYQYHILDRCFRGASDIISCETTAVNSNTASLIQWCRQWSAEAVFIYNQVAADMTIARNGKPPTHRQVCDARDSNGKRWFTAEHEFPLTIVKKGVRDHAWTLEQARLWLWDYSVVTIVTQAENKRLLPWTDDMDTAANRYADAKIVKQIHPRYGDADER